MREWNDVYDIVVVGSGAGALTAAITAQHQGLSVLVIEKMHCWGGTSAYSDGGLWVPNNDLMQRTGAPRMQNIAVASGNTTASVMGQTYPGPGSTLGPACTFAYIAMNPVAQQD